MSGICDTCRREPCHMRFDGCKTCDVYEGGETRYEQLFGTPERAARTLARMCQGVNTCATCPLFGAALNHCENDYTDFASIAEWLRGDAE